MFNYDCNTYIKCPILDTSLLDIVCYKRLLLDSMESKRSCTDPKTRLLLIQQFTESDIQ